VIKFKFFAIVGVNAESTAKSRRNLVLFGFFSYIFRLESLLGAFFTSSLVSKPKCALTQALESQIHHLKPWDSKLSGAVFFFKFFLSLLVIFGVNYTIA
jgi:hypothetical protein